MYPFSVFDHAQVVQRLQSLQSNNFEFECVVAATQTIEQALKRVIVRRMNTRGVGVKRDGRFFVRHLLASVAERNASVRLLAGIGPLEQAWDLLVAEVENPDECVPTLESTVEELVGRGAWMAISAKHPVRQPILGGAILCGLFELRNQLVHGWHLPPKESINLLTPFGISAVEKLFHPATGVNRLARYDPFVLMPKFRARAV